MLLQLLLTSLRKNIFSKETHDHEIGTTGLEDKEKVAGTTTLTGGPIEGTMIGIIIEAEDEIIEIGITETIEIIGTIGITVTTETIEMFETIVMIAIVIIGTTVTMGEEEREEITTRIMIDQKRDTRDNRDDRDYERRDRNRDYDRGTNNQPRR
jgi:hypothetical protein